MAANSFDVVVLGATGFTGKLACEYLSRKAPSGLRWAMAGRNTQKLEAFRSELPEAGQQIPILQVDVGNDAQLKDLATATKVIANYAGSPYHDKGLPVVSACVSAGCCYVDITGEPPFVRNSADRYDAKAKETNALIVHCTGFDCIPSDMGAWLAAKTMRERHGTGCAKMRFVSGKSLGGASGGTIHTALSVLSEGNALEGAAASSDIYGLDPPGSQRGPDTGDFGDKGALPGWDATAGCWGAPFVMAPVNARVVRRSNALSGYSYGQGCSYGEIMEMPGPVASTGTVLGMGIGLGLVMCPPTRWALKRWVLPEPGQGPSRKTQEEGFFEARTVAVGQQQDGEAPPKVTVHVQSGTGGDPGYKCTALMSIESALCLALQRSDLPCQGGVVTPAVAFGQVLIDRLNAAGMKLFAEPAVPSKM